MAQQLRLDYLLKVLLEEGGRHGIALLPRELADKKLLFRALLNERPPNPVSDEFLKIQDEYLQAETAAKGITDSSSIPASAKNSRIAVWQGDITLLRVGAIVNAANSGLIGCFVPNHACIDNAIHSFAGVQLRLECAELMRLQGHEEQTGSAKLTRAYNLPCDYILHTVGPIIYGPLTEKDCESLAACYRSCLELASAHGIESVAFCCISTGEFRFPNQKAAEIAIQTVTEFLQTNHTVKKVIFNVFKDADRIIYENLLG